MLVVLASVTLGSTSPMVVVLASATLGSTSSVATTVRRLTAMSAARLISDEHVDEYRRKSGVVLRGVSSAAAVPLRQLGNPSPQELSSVADECDIAAALVSRLLGAEALRDPFGEWHHCWDNAYDHYTYWRMLTNDRARRVAMVVLPREPLLITLCGYPESVVKRTAYSSTAYPKSWCGADLSARTDLAEPEIELDAGDAIILDGTNSEGLGGLGGGHLVYRFEMCAADCEEALWVTPSPSLENEMLQQFAVAVKTVHR
jgi:hypothetical protein